MKIINFIDLFGGIGGFRLAIEKITDWKCVWYNDNNKYAVKIYNKQFGETNEARDIREVHEMEIPHHDIICAGFPCQSFSIAGKRLGLEDTRGTLFYEICRIAQYHKPQLIFLENVRGILSSNNGRDFTTILTCLQKLGYSIEWQLLNSRFFGVPQRRERVFIIGHLGGFSGKPIFPIRKADRIYTPSIEPITTCLDANYHKGWLDHGQRTVLAIKTDNEVKNGIGRFSKFFHIGKLRGVIFLDNKADKLRRLTPVECERLQGFPDKWTEGISDTQRYKCIGQAVTVNVVETIVKKMKKNLA